MSPETRESIHEWLEFIAVLGHYLFIASFLVCSLKLVHNYRKNQLVTTIPAVKPGHNEQVGVLTWTESSAGFADIAGMCGFFLVWGWLLPAANYEHVWPLQILWFACLFAVKPVVVLLPALYQKVFYGLPLSTSLDALCAKWALPVEVRDEKSAQDVDALKV